MRKVRERKVTRKYDINYLRNIEDLQCDLYNSKILNLHNLLYLGGEAVIASLVYLYRKID